MCAHLPGNVKNRFFFNEIQGFYYVIPGRRAGRRGALDCNALEYRWLDACNVILDVENTKTCIRKMVSESSLNGFDCFL